MLKLFPKQVLTLSVVVFLALSAFAPFSLPAQAAPYDPSGSNYGLNEFSDVDIGKSEDLKATIARIINIALGFLGILAVVFILYGGFMWMTAAGNEEQVGKARKMIVQAVVGLAVIFAAWVIANFAISQLQDVTNVGGR